VRSSKGFSLFELLVVLVLLGLVTSVIAPSIDTLLRQFRTDEEQRQLRQEIYNRSAQAFAQERLLRVYIAASRVVVTQDINQSRDDAFMDRGALVQMNFDYLDFVPAEMILMPSGRIAPSVLLWRDQSGRQRELRVSGLLSDTSDG
jgi:type II secretion system protein H